MNHSTPGLPVHHHLPEFTQIHVHWVGDAIQPSHPLSSPSPPTFNLSLPLHFTFFCFTDLDFCSFDTGYILVLPFFFFFLTRTFTGSPYVGCFTVAVRPRGGHTNPTFPRRNFKGFVDIFLNDQSFSMMIFHEIVLTSLPTLNSFS